MKKWLVLCGLVGAFLLGGAEDVAARKYEDMGLAGKVKSVRTIYGFGTLQELSYECHFSKDGMILDQIHYRSGSPTLVIRYDSKEREKEEMAGDILKLSYVYDEANQKYEVRDHKGEVVYFGNLDDQGRISSRESESLSFSDRTDYTYDGNGRLI